MAVETQSEDRVVVLTISDDSKVGDLTSAVREHPDESVVLVGSGSGFLLDATSPAQSRATQELAVSCATHRLPVVAVIGADALGPAFDVALFCDLRFAADGVRMGPRLFRRLDPRPEVAERLSLVAGPSLASRMCLLGEEMVAGEPGSDRLAFTFEEPIAEKVSDITQRLSAMAPLALEALKILVGVSGTQPFAAGIAIEADLASLLIPTADRAEGLEAFASKREPEFEGR